MVRIKHRYLLVNVLYPGDEDRKRNGIKVKDDLPWTVKFRQPTADTMTSKQFSNMIRRGVEELFGDYGAGMIGGSLNIKYFSPATSTAIIRVARAHYRMVWSALTFLNQLAGGQPCVIQVVRVSGTIRKSEEEAIRRARVSILQAKTSSGLILPATVEQNAVDVSAGIEDSDDMDDDSG